MENHMPIVKPDKIPTEHNYCAVNRDLNLNMEADWDAMYRMLDYIQEWYKEHGCQAPTCDDQKIVDVINFLTKILPGTIEDWQTIAMEE
jgi:hypothetical protein